MSLDPQSYFQYISIHNEPQSVCVFDHFIMRFFKVMVKVFGLAHQDWTKRVGRGRVAVVLFLTGVHQVFILLCC